MTTAAAVGAAEPTWTVAPELAGTAGVQQLEARLQALWRDVVNQQSNFDNPYVLPPAAAAAAAAAATTAVRGASSSSSSSSSSSAATAAEPTQLAAGPPTPAQLLIVAQLATTTAELATAQLADRLAAGAVEALGPDAGLAAAELAEAVEEAAIELIEAVRNRQEASDAARHMSGWHRYDDISGP